ncbi:MAG: hypothetical protein ACERKV_11090 [Clostridiaceae bacterium]
MSKKIIKAIIAVGGLCFLGLIQQSRKFISNDKIGLLFNLLCFIAAICLIVFSFLIKKQKKKVLTHIAVITAIISFVSTIAVELIF